MSAQTSGSSAPRQGPRWGVAERIAQALRARYGWHIQAIGVHGALAHGDDADGSDIDMIVITRPAGTVGAGPIGATRRVDGVVVDLAVIDADEYLRHARTLTTSWPITADQYITTAALHDPDGWFPQLRDTHLERLARTETHTFAALARVAWCRASGAHAKASRLAEWHETDAALASLCEARLGVAIVEGLLTRTYFRSAIDAVARTRLAGSPLHEVGRRLSLQADELTKKGRPVDGTIDDLVPPGDPLRAG